MDGCTDQTLISEWVVAILVVKFDEKHGQQVCAKYPENGILSEGVISDLKMMSMPECAQADVCHSYNYMIRVRIKDHPTNPNTFYNCFTAFQQRKDSNSARGFFQQSVILVCKYPIQQLAYSILGRLLEVLEDIPQFRNKLAVVWSNVNSGQQPVPSATTVTSSGLSSEVSSGSSAPSFILPEVMAIVEVAYQHFLQWPDLKGLFKRTEARAGANLDGKSAGGAGVGAGDNMINYSLPFYGSIFTVNLPFTIFHPFSTLYAHTSMGTVCSIMEVLEPLGLLPHVFLLWECLMRGKDIVVYSPSAATCSAVVTTLLSLIAPPLHCFTGDVRPFISLYDSDTKVFAKHINKKYKDYCTGSGSTSTSSSGDLGDCGNNNDDASLPAASIHNCNQYISSNGIFDSNKDRTADFTLPRRQRAPVTARATAVDMGGTSAGTSPGTCVNAHPRSSIIIGITNPFLLKDYNYADVVLLMANPDYLPLPKSVLSLSTAVDSINKSLADNLESIRRRPSLKMFSNMFASATSSVSNNSSATTTVNPPNPPSSPTPAPCVYEQCTIPDSVVRIIDDTNSERHPQDSIIEHYYDKWVARGGLQGKCGGIICVRQYAFNTQQVLASSFSGGLGSVPQEERFDISEDRQLLAQIGWYSANSNQFLVEALEKRRENGLPSVSLNSGHIYKPSVTPLSSAVTVIRSAVVPYDPLNPNSRGVSTSPTSAAQTAANKSHPFACARYDSDRYVIGNKLLKEAFRNLTLGALRPFSPYCTVDNDLMHVVQDSPGRGTGAGISTGADVDTSLASSLPPVIGSHEAERRTVNNNKNGLLTRPFSVVVDSTRPALVQTCDTVATADLEKPPEESVFVDSSAAEMACSAFSDLSASPVPPGANSNNTDNDSNNNNSVSSCVNTAGLSGDNGVSSDVCSPEQPYRVYDVDAALFNYQYLLPLWELPSRLSECTPSHPYTSGQVLAATKHRTLTKSIPESYYAKNCPPALRRCTLAEYTEFLSDVSGTAHCHAYIQYKRNVVYRKIVQGLCDSYANLTLAQVLVDFQIELKRAGCAGLGASNRDQSVEVVVANAEIDAGKFEFTAEQVHVLLGRMRRCWYLYTACMYPGYESSGASIAGPGVPGMVLSSTCKSGAGIRDRQQEEEGDELCLRMQRHYAGVSVLLRDIEAQTLTGCE